MLCPSADIAKDKRILTYKPRKGYDTTLLSPHLEQNVRAASLSSREAAAPSPSSSPIILFPPKMWIPPMLNRSILWS
ncbi:hypothetical protein PROFUN_08422 [Planoprotostelium fungivorum]|uniref:Uncharacterized protein n=1 Tax=Planoprotostelium fungivorum TaxID=1890364 RepID=A0A2P6NJV2_9EUKA|nr:hypothetical protein PROFUN_08422 [Planoprotostelium fungivorum]